MLNLTRHCRTENQQSVTEPNQKDKETIRSLLTFEDLPSQKEVKERAIGLRIIASSYQAKEVMIGGAPMLMSTLEKELISSGIRPFYAFSKRESVERMEDNKVIKTNVFKHIGFYKVKS